MSRNALTGRFRLVQHKRVYRRAHGAPLRWVLG